MLWLTPGQFDTIIQHANADAPHEACGLIAGKGVETKRIIPTLNIAEHPEHRFYIDPSALSRHLADIEREGLDLIGIYHSHPNGEPIPSPTDVRDAAYPETIQVIIGLKHQRANVAAWHIRHGRVERVELFISENAPLPNQSNARFSPAQRNAVILSAVIAATLVLILSLALLPPAPPIP